MNMPYVPGMSSPTLDRQQIAKRLKDARKLKKLSAQQVADHLGMGIKGFYHWESGAAMPDLIQLKVLARLYQASTDMLLFGSNFGLLTDELEVMLARLDQKELLKVENIVRASLDMEQLQAPAPIAAKRKA